MSKTILIVEDDDDIRESLRDAFEDEGYAVQTAGNGLEGLRSLEKSAPSLVVMDLIMPVMTGNQLYARMQADPRFARIPVIISTSDTTRAPEGVLTFRKPLDLTALLEATAKFCSIPQE